MRHQSSAALRERILALVEEYSAQAFAGYAFVPGETPVPVSGKVHDAEEMRLLVDSALDFWLTTGRYAEQFEAAFSQTMGLRYAALVNSGSSANLVAVSALTSPWLGDARLKPGDEVITVAAGFPTTVNPIIQNRLVPVFLDITIPSYQVDVNCLEQARSQRTRAVVLAHTLGNTFDLDAVTEFCRRYDLWLVEDCCDAVGSTYRGKKVGTFGDIATVSFYPAHHITMGEGGCVLTDDSTLKRAIESLRDWGRDCWCAPGKDNTCKKRFEWQLGKLPFGYDHKYIYSHIGYNLKLTDMQAAVGVAQLSKLPNFIAARKQNFSHLQLGLSNLSDVLILPEATSGAEPSWFGFPICVHPDAPFERNALVRYLDQKRISTRLLFGGNLLAQPAYRDVEHRVIGDLGISNRVMEGAFWVGVFPGLTAEMLDYVIETIGDFVRRRQSR